MPHGDRYKGGWPLPILSTVIRSVLVVMVLPDPFRGMGTETQRSGHAPRPGSEAKSGRSSAKDGATEMLRCGTIQEASYIPQRVSAGATRAFYPALAREGCDRSSEVGTVHQGWYGEGPVPPRKPKESGKKGSCEKGLVSEKNRECAQSLQWSGPEGGEHWQRRAPTWPWRASLLVHLREVQHDRGPTGSLDLHGRIESRKGPKYPRMTPVGETLGS